MILVINAWFQYIFSVFLLFILLYIVNIMWFGLPNNCTQDTTKRRDAYTSSKIFTNLTCGAKQSYDVVIMKPPLLELVEVHRILAIYADKGYTGKDFCDRIHKQNKHVSHNRKGVLECVYTQSLFAPFLLWHLLPRVHPIP